MTCPQIYLGSNRFSSAPPLPTDYANDSIILASYDVVQNQDITVQVKVLNHGTDAAPQTQIELYWTTPGTFVAPVNLINQYDFAAGEIPGAVTFPPSEGIVLHNFDWTPPTIGHFCLLARLKNLMPPAGACLEQSYGSDPTTTPPTDPLQAIHNVNVIAPPSPHRGPRRAEPMWFAFAAGNSFHGIQETKLHVRPLDPVKDRAKLEALVALPGLNRTLARRGLKFGVPAGVQVAEGRERIFLPHTLLNLKPGALRNVPQIARLGEISEQLAPHLLLPGTRLIDVASQGPIDLKLLPGEQQQTFVRLEPAEHENAVYAVEVSHAGADGRPIGGLVMLFVPPHDYF